MIEAYSYGKIIIDGHSYSSDVMIYPDGRVDASWWRRNGHELVIDDIAGLIASGPSFIVCGTGMPGLLRPHGDLDRGLRNLGIELIRAPSRKAVDIYNEQNLRRKTGA